MSSVILQGLISSQARRDKPGTGPSLVLSLTEDTLPDDPWIPPLSLAPETLTPSVRICCPLSNSLSYALHGIGIVASPRLHPRRVDSLERHTLKWPAYRDAVTVDKTGLLEVVAHNCEVPRPDAEAGEEQCQAEQNILIGIQCAVFDKNMLMLLLDV